MGGLPPISDQELEKTLQALNEAGGNQAEAARRLGIPRSTLQSRVAKRDPFPIVPGKSILYDAQSGEEKLIWATGKGIGAPTGAEVAASILEVLKDYKPPAALRVAPKDTQKDLATIIPLADLHLGLLSWGRETGIDWDLKIALQTYKRYFEELISLSPPSDTGIILGLGDLLHADNYEARTKRSGNILDVDGRYPKILEAAFELIVYIVDLCQHKFKNILIRILPGNHDDQSALAITLSLKVNYKASKNITVDDNAGRFFYYQWGKCLVGATHGDQCKMKEFPGECARMVPKMWGETEHRILFTGHIHNEKTFEKGGAIVHSLQSPTAPDAWTVGMGFGAGRSIQSITLHKELGRRATQVVNVK